jgi:hypothetical protein
MTLAQTIKLPLLAAYGALMRGEVYSILLPLFKRLIVERLADGSTIPASASRADERPTVLFLSAEAFRGDPQLLAASGHLRVLELSRRCLTHTFHQFYPKDLDARNYRHFMCPTPADPTYEAKNNYQRVLRALLAQLRDALGIECVVGHHFHHMYDVDWGASARAIGLPYIVFHREGISFSRFAEDRVRQRIGGMGTFDGTIIAIQSPAAREVCISSGFVDPDRIVPMGAIRMDAFTKRIRQAGAHPRDDGIALLFAFGFSAFRDQLIPFMDKAHISFLRAAQAMPERQFVIKCKGDMMTGWRRHFDRACQSAAINPSDLPNLRITSKEDPNELILQSSVVTTFNSSTMLEAGVAGRTVILPFFEELRQPEIRDYLYFYPDAYELFDAPTNQADYEAALIGGLQRPIRPSDEEMRQRHALFERHFSPVDGGVTDRYIDLVKQYVAESRSTR